MKKQTKLSDILKAMKKIVAAREGTTYLCFLLNGFYNYANNSIIYRIPGSRAQKVYLIRWIRKMLGVSSSLEGWMWNHRNRRYPNSRRAKEARLAWLDWMIAECEKTGD